MPRFCNTYKGELAFLLIIILNISVVAGPKTDLHIMPCDIISSLQGEKESKCKKDIFI